MSDYRTTDGESPPPTPRQVRRRMVRAAAYSAFFLAIVFSCLVFIRVEHTIPATGYVMTEDYAEVRSPRSGRIAEILVSSGGRVSAGEVLTRLDDSEALTMLEQSGNQAEKARAQLERLTRLHGDRRLKHEKALALAELRFKAAVGKLELTELMNERGLASDMSVEDSRLAKEVAAVELDALRNVDETLDEKELDVLREEVKSAENAVKLHRIRLDEYLIRAPISGKAIRHGFVTGEVVSPEMVLYELFGGDRLVMKLMVDERHAALVGVGRKYRARLTPFKGLKRIWFHGEVVEARGVIETHGGKMGKMIECTFDPGAYDVHPGCSAEAELLIGKAPLWRLLLGVYK